MTPEQWQRVRPILESALELDPAGRPAFLDQACTDRTLRNEVESLIASHEQAGTDLLNPTSSPTLKPDEETRFRLPPGKRIGAYEILEEIAVGGMGAVYRAVRADGQYKQQVALKIVRSELGAEFTTSRFKNERQILASLNHPNIAKILDGGATPDGVPYFVMEFVEGQRIDNFCDAQKLSTTERLDLFLQICSAVQYAHQHLVIHRDIKPGNILVNAEGVPKLLDFGIAKTLESSDAADQPEQTISLVRLLTPEYASPEQIKGAPITTASDVYSLGVVLYELLTGCAPYNVPTHTPHELSRAVCETEPERPSMMVLRQKPSANEGERKPANDPDLTATREGSPEKLSKRLSGDLDNIVLMALRKEPQRRYASVEQFREDIRRHLENLPVIARKDTARYRTTKFIARHKVGVAATAIVVLTLAIGIAFTVHEARIAQRRFDDLRSLASSLIFDVHDAIRDLPGSTPARKLIVAKAVKYLDSLARDGQGDPSLQRELAAGYRRIGEVDSSNLGDPAGAVASYRKALTIRQALLASRSATLDDLVEFAETTRLSVSASLKIDTAQSTGLETLQHAAQMLEQALAQHPRHPDIIRVLARNYAQQAGLLSGAFGLFHLGNVMAALQPRRRELELTEQLCALQPNNPDFRRDLADSLGFMGDLLYATGKEDEASQDYVRAEKILETLSAESPTPKILMALYDSHYRMGPIKLASGDLQGATAEAHRTVEIANQLSTADPVNTMPQLLLAAAYSDLGDAMSRAKDHNAANSAIANSMRIDADLVKNHPGDREFRHMQALRYEVAASDFQRQGEPSKALRLFEQALATFSEVQRTDPSNAGNRHYLAAAYNGMGWNLALLHRPREAEESHRKALRFAEPDATASHPDEEALYRVADAYSGLADDENILAEETAQSKSAKIEHWENSRNYYQQSLKVWSQVPRPKLISPEGNDCVPPTAVAQRLDRVNAMLSDFVQNH
jgi:serine/threonine protein kinase